MSSAKPKKPRFEVINYYEKIPKLDQALYHYPNEELMQITLPFRALILGPSGLGKTNIALNIISGVGIWDQIVILAKNLEEPLYKYTIETIQKIEKSQKRRILLAINDIDDLPPLDAFHPDKNTLLIVDDFVADSPKKLAPLEELWLRGRKNSISAIFISQSYFRTLMMIRQNTNYVFFKKIGSAKDLKRIVAEYSMEVPIEEILKKYKTAVAGPMTNFFLIDLKTTDPALRFRHCFEPMGSDYGSESED